MPKVVVPVAGVSPQDLRDSFGAPRSGSRRHKGIDIFAPAGTPVLAAVSGEVIRAGNSGGLGGIRVWIKGEDGKFHYYAHLQEADVRPGQKVRAGQPIGKVGNTGNARSTPPHLHYSINTSSTRETGEVNPFDVLVGAVPVDAPARKDPLEVRFGTKPHPTHDHVEHDDPGIGASPHPDLLPDEPVTIPNPQQILTALFTATADTIAGGERLDVRTIGASGGALMVDRDLAGKVREDIESIGDNEGRQVDDETDDRKGDV